jgi:hypothetical protein
MKAVPNRLYVSAIGVLAAASMISAIGLGERERRASLPVEVVGQRQPDAQDASPAQARKKAGPQLTSVMQEHVGKLIRLYGQQARQLETFQTHQLGELTELRALLCQSQRLDLVVSQLASSTTCKTRNEDSVVTRYLLGRLILDVMASARERSDELEIQLDGRYCWLSTPVPGRGHYMPGTAPANVEDPVQRAAYILRIEENGHIARLLFLRSRVTSELDTKRVQLRRLVRAHVSAGTDDERAFLMDLLDVDEIMSKTDREDFFEQRNRPAPPHRDE